MNKILYALLFFGAIFCVNQEAFAGKSKPKKEKKPVISGTSVRKMKINKLELFQNCLEEALINARQQANAGRKMNRTLFEPNKDGEAENWAKNCPLNSNQRKDWEPFLED